MVQLLSYFSGGGFLDLGFELEKFNVVWSNEISKEFSKVYSSGLSSVLNKECKISSNTPIQELEIKDIKKNIIKNINSDLWGIIGGPPCPDFSVGGRNKGKEGVRGYLSQIYIKHICTLKPSFFLFENVKGLFLTKKHRNYFNELIVELENAGFAVDFKLMNALDLGVPQDRERIFIFGTRKKYFENKFGKKYTNDRDWFIWPKNEKYFDAKSKFKWPQMNTNNDIPELPKDIPIELMVGNYILDQEKLSKLPNADDFFNPKSEKFNNINEGDTSGKSFKRLHRWRYSPTVAYGNNEVHLHPVLPRRLSVREALILQSVPDSYYIENELTLSDKFKVIGNGVPVTLGREIAKSIKVFFDIKT